MVRPDVADNRSDATPASGGLELSDLRVDLLQDGVFTAGRDVLIHRQGEAALSRVLGLWGDRPFSVDVNCFLVRGSRGVRRARAATCSRRRKARPCSCSETHCTSTGSKPPIPTSA